jgi:AICAR transformylase/IMP cyclohydrolase PurH
MANEEYALKYGLNPHQGSARVFRAGGLPFEVVNGRAGTINLMDALNGWQLARELEEATGRASAASFKHVSPAGAASAATDPTDDVSPLCGAYLRARDADPMSSYGDFVALSRVCDVDTARAIKREVSDGVIAPGYEPEALNILRTKRGGSYCVVQIDPSYRPEPIERREIFGVTFEQERDEARITPELLTTIVSKRKDLPIQAAEDLLIALVVLKYTQSNSVCYVRDGQTIGIGAGQQSRIHCTRLAGDKADRWWLHRHPKVAELPFVDGLKRADRNNAIDLYVSGEPLDPRAYTRTPEPLTAQERAEWLATLTGVALGSDAFFPFSDNIERAHRSGVRYIAEPGGSMRDDVVIEAADAFGMVLCFTGLRLFHH